MVSISPRLQPHLASHPRNQDGPCRCALQMRFPWHISRQYRCSHLPGASHNQHTGPSSHLSYPIFLPVWPPGSKSYWEPTERVSSISLLSFEWLEVWRQVSLLQRLHVHPTRVLPCPHNFITLLHHPWSCRSVPYQGLSRMRLLVARTVHLCK